ncbi:hypothetical protein [Micromonospora sp. CB01531]|uniref:hypothetical protein n=1 Tax=Micromonospora sp. CB01531 TaxID=1718947 RepID=UPI000A7F201E|nr:hypothetical protein [Micromonospora sp. CB01531]
MEWRTRWHITIRWDRAENSPSGVSVVERVVDSTAELRRLVDRARAGPQVVAIPHRRVREPDSTRPGPARSGCRGGPGRTPAPQSPPSLVRLAD